jgi:hypothetical protein
VVPAGTEKTPYHVRVWPDCVGSEMLLPPKELEEVTYVGLPGLEGRVTTISSNVASAVPVFENVTVAVVVPPMPLEKQVPFALCVVATLLIRRLLCVAGIGASEPYPLVVVCFMLPPLVM